MLWLVRQVNFWTLFKAAGVIYPVYVVKIIVDAQASSAETEDDD